MPALSRHPGPLVAAGEKSPCAQRLGTFWTPAQGRGDGGERGIAAIANRVCQKAADSTFSPAPLYPFARTGIFGALDEGRDIAIGGIEFEIAPPHLNRRLFPPGPVEDCRHQPERAEIARLE